jgi:dTMP kinase
MFITLEGTEGVGKSSNLEFIRQWLVARGKTVVQTREPGGTPLAEEIRALLLAPRAETMHEDTELLLMFAARAQHVAGLIRPALARGDWVLSDRFHDASFAYQGGGRGIAVERLARLSDWALRGFAPDLTFWLDMDPAEALERAKKRAALDRFEQEKLEFFQRVRAVYRLRAEAEPQRFVRVDAGLPLTEVQARLAAVLTERLS